MRIKRFNFGDIVVDRVINKLIVHCSATDKYDGPEMIKMLHTLPPDFEIEWDRELIKCRGWNDIAYHFIIDKKGKVHKGRPMPVPGAHTFRENENSIGICVCGLKKSKFTSEQMTALYYLVQDLCERFDLHPKLDTFPHHFFAKYKSCPVFKLPDFYVGSALEKQEGIKIGGVEAIV